MREDELLRTINRMAQERHLLLFHCRNSIGSLGRGFPDMVIAGPGGTAFAELKTNGAALTPDQRHWGSVLEKSGQLWLVWRPRDLQAGVIEDVLNGLAVYKQDTLM